VTSANPAKILPERKRKWVRDVDIRNGGRGAIDRHFLRDNGRGGLAGGVENDRITKRKVRGGVLEGSTVKG